MKGEKIMVWEVKQNGLVVLKKGQKINRFFCGMHLMMHTGNGEKINFEIDEFRKHCLINGLDDIGLTMQKQSNIDDFEKKREAEKPWI